MVCYLYSLFFPNICPAGRRMIGFLSPNAILMVLSAKKFIAVSRKDALEVYIGTL